MCGAERRTAPPRARHSGTAFPAPPDGGLRAAAGELCQRPCRAGRSRRGHRSRPLHSRPERVETYSGATIDECRIENAVVLAWNKTDDRITGAEVVATVMGNGTQQPPLRF